jgi:hypothetical protein
MSKLKLFKLPAFAATVKVRVAGVTEPAAKTVPASFHVKLKYEVAVGGFQLEVVMLSVSAVLPVFLMYTVWLTEVPGVNVPQLILVQLFVVAASV